MVPRSSGKISTEGAVSAHWVVPFLFRSQNVIFSIKEPTAKKEILYGGLALVMSGLTMSYLIKESKGGQGSASDMKPSI